MILVRKKMIKLHKDNTCIINGILCKTGSGMSK